MRVSSALFRTVLLVGGVAACGGQSEPERTEAETTAEQGENVAGGEPQPDADLDAAPSVEPANIELADVASTVNTVSTAPEIRSEPLAPPRPEPTNDVSPGAPGETRSWTHASKTGLGTSYEAYLDGGFSDAAETGVVSHVWFTLAQSRLTEVSYGGLHDLQLRDWRFLVTGPGFEDNEAEDMVSAVSYLAMDDDGRPLAPAFVIESRDRRGDYVLTRTILTDPDAQALVMQVSFEARAPGLSLYMLVDPAIAGTGSGDFARAGITALQAHEGDVHLAVVGDRPFEAASAGFAGVSDGAIDLEDGAMDWTFAATGDEAGDVALAARLSAQGEGVHEHLLALGFGASSTAALGEAANALAAGFDDVRARYVGDGQHVGWSDYLASLSRLPGIAAQAGDGGALAFASALVLKALEDKSAPGEISGFLGVPWGEGRIAAAPPSLRAVGPWMTYESGLAFFALGDEQTGQAAAARLRAHGPGSAARAVLLSSQVLLRGAGQDGDAAETFALADALVSLWDAGGPSRTRWGVSDTPGYAEASVAASALTAAGDLAARDGEAERARRYRSAAQRIVASIEARLSAQSEGYDPTILTPALYGHVSPFNRDLAPALAALDAVSEAHETRLRYVFRQPDGVFPGWRRYADDGYGESVETGAGFVAGQVEHEGARGRVWPVLSAERGRFDLSRAVFDGELSSAERAVIRNRYVAGLETFANEGLMLPQQVWDGVGANPDGYIRGEGSGAPAPYAWAHAGYLLLLDALARADEDAASGSRRN